MTEDDLETAKAYYEENEMGDYIVIPTPEAFAQALAAAREEGRREGIEIAADDLEKFAMVVELLSTRDDATQAAKDLRAAAKKLRNLPTNAPEGESDE